LYFWDLWRRASVADPPPEQSAITPHHQARFTRDHEEDPTNVLDDD
jgi:hypothetical protein